MPSAVVSPTVLPIQPKHHLFVKTIVDIDWPVIIDEVSEGREVSTVIGIAITKGVVINGRVFVLQH